MQAVNDNKLVLSIIKKADRPCSINGVLLKTDLSYARVRESLRCLRVAGVISPGGRGVWVAVENRPTEKDIFIGLFLMFVFGLGCGYIWHYMAIS